MNKTNNRKEKKSNKSKQKKFIKLSLNLKFLSWISVANLMIKTNNRKENKSNSDTVTKASITNLRKIKKGNQPTFSRCNSKIIRPKSWRIETKQMLEINLRVQNESKTKVFE